MNLTAIYGLDASGNATLLGYEDYLNGLPANASPVPVFLADTMVLPVAAADLGLTSTASASGGCGCGSAGAGASSLLTLLGLAALARRRRASVA
ncbi:MAG TPA: MYXO-CTERM sorting domain-containing protein [Anaeromyxobacter sp.]